MVKLNLEIFEKKILFHTLETEENSVISTGAGILNNDEVIQMIKKKV